MYQIDCAGVSLNCNDLVAYLQGMRGKCTHEQLLASKPMRDVAKQYSDAIGNQGDVSWFRYEWFADMVVGALLLSGTSIAVAFDPTEIKWSVSQ